MRAVCVIPARYASQRFPGKVLAELAGKPIVQHVVERASQARGLDHVMVATDDERVKCAVEAFGGTVVMTDPGLASGTDRVAAALKGFEYEVVVNLQGDEPLINPNSIERLVQAFQEDEEVRMGSLMCLMEDKLRQEDPNVVKVVVDRNGDALYFSRSLIPYPREGGVSPAHQHVGLYGFRRETLELFVSLPQGRLEKIEKLEQLRALENGIKIRMILVDSPTVGVDTPEDLERVRSLLRIRVH